MAVPPEPLREPAGDSVDAPGDRPQWRRRAIDRSTQAARQRAAKRVHRFLHAAREILAEKGNTEFTVQEVVDRSEQSLRSFYQYFDGKHELLLALFEEETEKAVERVKSATSTGGPLDRLQAAVIELCDVRAPGRVSAQPLLSEFATRLMVHHPAEVAEASAPILDYLTVLVAGAAESGLLRPGEPRRMAAIVLHSATAITEGRGDGEQPITAEEVWEFCLHAIVPDPVAARRAC